MKILVVDDMEDARYLLEEALKSEGYEVTSACNGLEALKLLGHFHADLIITELLMPVMDGFEICRYIRQDNEFKNIPFIFYSATCTGQKDIDLAVKLGATRFVVKPQSIPDIINIIHDVLSEAPPLTPIHLDTDFSEIEVLHTQILSQNLISKINELEHEREKFTLLLDAMPALMSELNNDLYFEMVNHTYEQWHGLSKDEIIGMHIRELNGDAAFEIMHPYLQRALQGEHVSFTARVPYKNNIERHIQVEYIPRLTMDKQVSGIYAIVADISEQVHSQENKEEMQKHFLQAQKMESLGELTAGISHDFNNILSSILGYDELLLGMSDYSDRDKIKSYLQQIHTAGERARDMIKQMLMFSKKIDIEKEPLQLSSLIEETLKLIKPAVTSSINIDVNTLSQLPLIEASSVQLQQVLVNLCINARDAMDGSGELSLHLDRVHIDEELCSSCHLPVAGDYAEIAVIDTGSGISRELQDRIFEPFMTTKEKSRGTGMGLSMVHGIIHDHGGHILLDSEPGEGTIFRILLPISPATIDSNDTIAAPTETACKTVQAAEILVVDDDVHLANFTTELLVSNGYHVHTCHNGKQALQQYQQHPEQYRLIITDQTMPEMTGVEMASAILKQQPHQAIILCTGYSNQVDAEWAKKLGIKEFLNKPFKSNELLQLVEQYAGPASD